ncbi:MAG: ABC transporter permease [Deltaproteobacteria bacterium]|nr:ABC transporter permease [Deltaproteobacteria bacterium]
MKLRIWQYYFKHALDNILSNRLVHAISIGTITISLILFGSFLLFFVNINSWMLEWGQSLSMSVYLKDDVDGKGMKRIESFLMKLPGAEYKGFVSKEQARKDLIKALGNQAGLLEGIEENPLPASFEVVFKDMKNSGLDAEGIKKKLEGLDGVDEVQYSEQWMDRFEGLLYILKVGGLVVGSLLCMAVLFIITNTIKLTIYSRKDEIEIYKIVGATDRFIKAPFLIEGAIQGFLGGLLALLFLFLLYTLLSLKPIYLFGLPVIDVVFLPNGYLIWIVFLSLGLGLAGSFIAIGRFFRLLG